MKRGAVALLGLVVGAIEDEDAEAASEAGADARGSEGTIDAGPDGPPPLPDLLVFVTSTKHDGKLALASTLDAADAMCQTLANDL